MTEHSASRPSPIRFQDCVLDADARILRRAGAVVELEPRVFDLLCLLASRPEHSFSKDEIAEALWPGRVISDTVISQCVRKARQGCGDSANKQRVIKTLHGVGYRFSAEILADDLDRFSDPPPASADARPAGGGGLSSPARLALWGLTVVLLVGLLSWRPWSLERVPALQRVTIASLPALESGLAGDSLSAGLEALLSRATAERSDIELIGAQRTLRVLDSLGLDPNSDNAALLEALQQTLGVDYLLRGAIEQNADGYWLRAELTGPGGLSRVIQPPAGELADMVRGFASDMARELGLALREPDGITALSADDFVNEAYVRALNALLAGDSRAAAALFRSVLELDPALVYARYELGNALWQLGEQQEAQAHYLQSLELAVARGGPRLAGHSATMLGVLAWQAGQLDEAERLYEQALEHYAEARDDHGAASALGNLGNLAEQRGDLERAEQLILKARERFRAARDQVGESATFTNLAVISRQRSRLHEAYRQQQQAAELQRRLGIGPMLVRSLTYLAALEIELGHWAEAEALIAEALAMAAEQDNAIGLAEARLELSRLAGRELRAVSASAAAAEALAGFEALGMPAGQALALALLAETDLLRGEAAQALVHLDQADHIDQGLSKPRDRAQRDLLRARALEQLGRLDDAGLIIDDLLRHEDRCILARTQAQRASLSWHSGDRQTALALWQQALATSETMDEPGLRAALRIRFAEASLDLDDRAVATQQLVLAGEWNALDPGLRLQQARLWLGRGETALARQQLLALTEAIELPEDAPFSRQLAALIAAAEPSAPAQMATDGE